MNTTLRIDAASEADAANQAPTTTSAIIESEKRTTEDIISAVVEAKLDEWLTRLVAVQPGQSPLAYGLAIGMRIAAVHPRPFKHYRLSRDPSPAPIMVSRARLAR